MPPRSTRRKASKKSHVTSSFYLPAACAHFLPLARHFVAQEMRKSADEHRDPRYQSLSDVISMLLAQWLVNKKAIEPHTYATHFVIEDGPDGKPVVIPGKSKFPHERLFGGQGVTATEIAKEGTLPGREVAPGVRESSPIREMGSASALTNASGDVPPPFPVTPPNVVEEVKKYYVPPEIAKFLVTSENGRDLFVRVVFRIGERDVPGFANLYSYSCEEDTVSQARAEVAKAIQESIAMLVDEWETVESRSVEGRPNNATYRYVFEVQKPELSYNVTQKPGARCRRTLGIIVASDPIPSVSHYKVAQFPWENPAEELL